MTQEESTGPVFWYDKVTARISKEYPLTQEEAFEEADRMVDYAELPAFSSLPHCIVDELDSLTVERLKNGNTENKELNNRD